jgi:predicted Na+-dependent transporter
LAHWRLHTSILTSIFALFPALGAGFHVLSPDVLTLARRYAGTKQ